MKCSDCGERYVGKSGVSLRMDGGIGDRKPFDLCSRCWRDGTSCKPVVEDAQESVSPEMVDALRKTGWTEHEVPGRPGLVRMEPPSPRDRTDAARRAAKPRGRAR